MPAETLLTAARRVVREFHIVMHDGGLITEHMEQAMHTLSMQVEKAIAAEKIISLPLPHEPKKDPQ